MAQFHNGKARSGTQAMTQTFTEANRARSGVRSLIVTGDHFDRGHLVLLNGVPRSISHTVFLVLLELVAAAFSKRFGYLPIYAVESTLGDPELTRQVIRRLRQQLGSSEYVRNNNQGAYCLAFTAEEIEIAELICDEARETGSALAVVNTKAAARSLYSLCNEQVDSVFHLSTNMCPAHRIKILDDIKEIGSEHGYTRIISRCLINLFSEFVE